MLYEKFVFNSSLIIFFYRCSGEQARSVEIRVYISTYNYHEFAMNYSLMFISPSNTNSAGPVI